MKIKVAICWLFILQHAVTICFAQTPNSSYDRSALTLILVNNSKTDFYSQTKKSFESSYNVDEKFDNHRLKYSSIEEFESLNRVAKSVVEKWFNRKEDGSFDMELIKSRGIYNANDAQVIQSSSTVRGTKALEDQGDKLIKNSYIVIYEFNTIETMTEYYNRMDQVIDERNREVSEYNRRADNYNSTRKPNQQPMTYRQHEKYLERKLRGYVANVKIKLYQVNWNEEIANYFYNNLWINEKDPSWELKKNQFDSYNFTLIDSKQAIFKTVNSNQAIQLGQHEERVSDEKLFDNLIAITIREGNDYIKTLEKFSVKSSVFSTKPITSKIGLKEGVSVDQKYFVFENVQKENGEIKQKRRGVIRATSKIVDNRQSADGKGGSTKFYQVSGKKLDIGMLLKQKNEAGLGITLGYGSHGFHGLMEFNVGRYIGIPGFKVFADLNIDMITYNNYSYDLSKKTGIKEVNLLNYGFERSLTTSVTGYSIGLSKDFNFGRNFVLIPHISYAVQSIRQSSSNYIVNKNKYYDSFNNTWYYPSSNTFEDSVLVSNSYITFGFRYGFNIAHNLQILLSSTTRYEIAKQFGEGIETDEYLPMTWEAKKNKIYQIGLRFQF
jgi:hypothetical protein